MNLRLILCAFGRHDWYCSQRGNLDSSSKTRRCTRCREPAQDGFCVTDIMGMHGFFRPLRKFD